VSLEVDQELPQKIVEGPLLRARERLQKGFLARDVPLDRAVHERSPVRREAHERAAAVRWILPPLHEPGLDQPIDPLGHPARGQQGRPEELAGIELERLADAAKSREHVEPTWLQPQLPEPASEPTVGELGGTEQAADDTERADVELGPLMPPLLEDLCDVIPRFRFHLLECIVLARIFLESYLPERHEAKEVDVEIQAEVADDRELDAVPTTMRAVRLHDPAGVESLVLEEVATPRLQPGEALVRVHAAAITRGELEWPLDRLPAIPSYEFSGVVVAMALGADGVSVGESVYALTRFDRDGAAAEYLAAPAKLLAPKPRSLGHVKAAALPLAGLSAWQGLFDHGRLACGERVLITGPAGGVGHLAVQLARWRGAHVIGARSAASPQSAHELGVHEVFVQGSLGGDIEPVDLVFDTAGGRLLRESCSLVREGGRLVSVAEEPPELGPGASCVETLYFVVEPSRDRLVEIGRLVDAGTLTPAIDSTFELADVRAAFARTTARGKHGKVVLRMA
jgi:NADPH:quinone reductase-like Zn-dependent oxidoreductase